MTKPNKKILITGGAGYIGQHLLKMSIEKKEINDLIKVYL